MLIKNRCKYEFCLCDLTCKGLRTPYIKATIQVEHPEHGDTLELLESELEDIKRNIIRHTEAVDTFVWQSSTSMRNFIVKYNKLHFAAYMDLLVQEGRTRLSNMGLDSCFFSDEELKKNHQEARVYRSPGI